MATTIKLKNGSGAPLAGDLVQGEPALDLTNKRLYTEDSGGTVIEVGTNPSTLTVDTTTLVVDAGNNRVGVGTASPSAKLTSAGVTGTTIIQALGGDTDGFADVEVKSTGTAGASRLFFSDTAAQSGLIRYSHSTNSMEFSTNATERMRIDSSGNVGIGNTAPNSYSFDTGPALVIGSGSNNPHLSVLSSTTGTGYLSFADGTTGNQMFRGLIEYAHSTDHMGFRTAGTERMRIDSSGNVGIGTTTPNSAGLGANGQTLQLGTRTFIATESGGDTRLGGLSGSNFTAFYQGGTERARIDVNGNLLVGKTSSSITTAGTEITSSSLLQSVSDTSTNLATNGGAALNLCNTSATNGNFSNIGGYNSNGLVVSQMNFINLNHASRTGAITLSTHDGTSLNEAMRIDSSGNVGIGTTSPATFNAAQCNNLVVGTGSGAEGITVYSGTTSQGGLAFADGTSASDQYRGLIQYDHNSNGMLFWTNTSERMRIDSSGTVILKGPDDNALQFYESGSEIARVGPNSGNLNFLVGTTTTPRMTIDSSGNVGIGTTSPNISSGASGSVVLTVSATTSGRNGLIELRGTRTSSGEVVSYLRTFNNSGATPLTDIQSIRGASDTVGQLAFFTSNTERMRIDSSGNLLVGKATANSSLAGIQLLPEGDVGVTRDGSHALLLNRLTSDGDIVLFRKDGTTVGSIKCRSSGGNLEIDTVQSGIDFAGDGWLPMRNGSIVDNDLDLGSSSFRFDDIYATNGTIQTSDANEKQDIEALSDAETRVAVAAKGLLRKFRWRSAVEEKGDEARVHFGIIAQDLQAAFEAEGLDAGDYAMFIHSTWTDEETGEERSRMGVRYSELLAFIIAAI